MCGATASRAMDSYVYAMPAGVYSLAMWVRRRVMDPRLVELPPKARNCFMRHEWPGATPGNRDSFPAEYENLECIVHCRKKYVYSACGCLIYPLSLGGKRDRRDVPICPQTSALKSCL